MYLYQAIFCLTVIYCALLLCHALENPRDHYKTLGLERTASERDIKRAFRELALKYHPDKNKKKGAQEKFMDITKAYEVLGNPHKKKVYDMTGSSTESFTGFKDVDFSHLFKQFSETLNAATRKQQMGEGFHNFNSGGFSDFSNLFSDMDAGEVNTFASQAEDFKNNELNEIIKEFSKKIQDIIGKQTKAHNSEDHYPDNQGRKN